MLSNKRNDTIVKAVLTSILWGSLLGLLGGIVFMELDGDHVIDCGREYYGKGSLSAERERELSKCRLDEDVFFFALFGGVGTGMVGLGASITHIYMRRLDKDAVKKKK